MNTPKHDIQKFHSYIIYVHVGNFAWSEWLGESMFKFYLTLKIWLFY